MSRIGKTPIEVPENVNVGILGNIVTAKGSLGELSYSKTDDIEVKKNEQLISVSPLNSSIKAKRMWGTTRTNIQNIITGVSSGFTKELEIQGVGYRAQVQGGKLLLSLGFSHEVVQQIPEGIDVKCSDQTHISIFGIHKSKVGQFAADIRSFRPPEPYKGKGIRYVGEYVVRKEGKKK